MSEPSRPHAWLRLARRVDRLNEWIGRAVYWLSLIMVLIGSFNAVARYGGRFIGMNLSSNAYIELQWYMFSVIFLLGAAYTLKHDAHVRVDVFYTRLSERGRAWIDLAGHLLFLIPFCLFVIWVSWPSIRNSWAVMEVSQDPGGLARYPIKTVIPVAFALLIAQGVAEAIKKAAVLAGVPPDELGGEPERHREMM